MQQLLLCHKIFKNFNIPFTELSVVSKGGGRPIIKIILYSSLFIFLFSILLLADLIQSGIVTLKENALQTLFVGTGLIILERATNKKQSEKGSSR